MITNNQIIDYSLYDWTSWLKIGNEIIPENHKKRIDDYFRHKMLWQNDNEVLKSYYKGLFRQTEVYKQSSFNELTSITNYCRRISDSLLNLCLSEAPKFSSKNEELEHKINKYVNEKMFINKLKQILNILSYGGNCFVRGIEVKKNGKKERKIQIIEPANVFLFKDRYTDELDAAAIVTQISKTQSKVWVKTEDEVKIFDVTLDDMGVITGIKEDKKTEKQGELFINISLFSDTEYNSSKYASIETLQANYINRNNQLLKMLDKFAAPILTGPDFVDDGPHQTMENGVLVVKTDDLQVVSADKKNAIETGVYFAIGEGENLRYVQADTKIPEQVNYIKKLEDDIVNAAQMETITFDKSVRSQITSAKALKLSYINAIDTSNAYCQALTQPIILMLKYLLNIPEDEEISITWNNGIADFYEDKIEQVSKRLDNRTITLEDAIIELDGLTVEQAREYVKKIKKEMVDEEEKTVEIKEEK